MRQLLCLVLVASCLVGCPDSIPSQGGGELGRAQAREAKPAAAEGRPEATASDPSGISSALSGSEERVWVRSQSTLGVPLHPRPNPQGGGAALASRAVNDSQVSVLDTAEEGRWLKVRAEDGSEGWVSRRYVVSGPARPKPASGQLDEGSVWASPEACKVALQAGERQPKAADQLRIASWNIRWFPDGVLGKASSPDEASQATHIAWLSCSIAWLGADILGVQEFKRGKSDPAAQALLRGLDQATGGEWDLILDSCPEDNRQHVGVLYNRRRVAVTDEASLAQMNPRGSLCADRLRPGFAAYVKLKQGVDLELLVVHLKSGVDARSYDLRRRSLAQLGDSIRERRARNKDQDFILLGDMNSMGCEGCKQPVSGAEEQALLKQELGGVGLSLLSPACSTYYRGAAGVLDHLALSAGLSKQSARSEANTAGICAELSCERIAKEPRAFSELSDHCPVWVDIPGADLD